MKDAGALLNERLHSKDEMTGQEREEAWESYQPFTPVTRRNW